MNTHAYKFLCYIRYFHFKRLYFLFIFYETEEKTKSEEENAFSLPRRGSFPDILSRSISGQVGYKVDFLRLIIISIQWG